MVAILPPTTCMIEYHDERGFAQLSAVLTTKSNLDGTYRLQVQSISDGGSSTTTQGGEFSTKSGRREDLSQATVTGGIGKWKAVLEIYDRSGNLVCHSNAPD